MTTIEIEIPEAADLGRSVWTFRAELLTKYERQLSTPFMRLELREFRFETRPSKRHKWAIENRRSIVNSSEYAPRALDNGRWPAHRLWSRWADTSKCMGGDYRSARGSVEPASVPQTVRDKFASGIPVEIIIPQNEPHPFAENAA